MVDVILPRPIAVAPLTTKGTSFATINFEAAQVDQNGIGDNLSTLS